MNRFGQLIIVDNRPGAAGNVGANCGQGHEVQVGSASQGLEATGSTPEQFRNIMRAEIGQWAKVIRDANIKAD